jgi:DNA-3-methyladenine glycosylase II
MQVVPWARAARAHLAHVDPVLARIINEVGPLRMVRRSQPFMALARAIIFQQLAGKAALAIMNRVIALYGNGRFPRPAELLATPDERLRAAGLSRQKLSYLKDLAAHFEDGALNFRRIARMDDEAVIRELTRVKGIGRWTAEMFLMFNLARPDVLPVDDLGLQNAMMRNYRLRKRPNRERFTTLGERWRPYRTAASWYLWQSLRITLPDAPTGRTKTRRVPTRRPA